MVAMRMAMILHRLSYVRQGHLVAVTRDDLVGQSIGHTAPKTKDVLKLAMGECSSVTRPTTSSVRKMNGTMGRKPSRSCSVDGEPARGNLSESLRNPWR